MEKLIEFIEREKFNFCNEKVFASIVTEINSPKLALPLSEKQEFFKNFEEYYLNIISPLNYIYGQSFAVLDNDVPSSKELLSYIESLILNYSSYFNEIANGGKRVEVDSNSNFKMLSNLIFKNAENEWVRSNRMDE